jgi:hypothetical protein
VTGSKGTAGAGFQISLEAVGLRIIRETQGYHAPPGNELAGMGRLAGVVFVQPSLKVLGRSNVLLIGMGQAAKQVYVSHGFPSAEA